MFGVLRSYDALEILVIVPRRFLWSAASFSTRSDGKQAPASSATLAAMGHWEARFVS